MPSTASGLLFSSCKSFLTPIRPNYSYAACLNNSYILVEEQQLSSADVVAMNSFKAERKGNLIKHNKKITNIIS